MNRWCEVQAPGCSGRATEMHHRLLRRHGGDDSPENLIPICANCHTQSPAAIHRNIAASVAAGLLIPSWEGPPTERWERELDHPENALQWW